MKYFSGYPITEVEGGNVYVLKEEFSYQYKAHHYIVIAPGFKTDFASIPRIFWRLYSPTGKRYFRAALIHDALYASELFTREECDEIFREAMKREGCNLFDRNVIYYSVRACGWMVWRKHNRKAGGSVEKARALVQIRQIPTLAPCPAMA